MSALVTTTSTGRPRFWLWLVLGALVVGLAALDREARTRGPGEPAAEAWIWDLGSTREVVPRAFYLVRDFEVPKPPTAAWLSVLADEEYLAYLNGVLVGSNRFSPGAHFDRYAVTSRLQAGGNRLIVEVRSSRGIGGLLVRLDDGAVPWMVSDEAWKVFRAARPGLFAGWATLEGGEPVKVWGTPPLGLWGRPGPGVEKSREPLLGSVEPLPRDAAVAAAAWDSPPPSSGQRFEAKLFDFSSPRVGKLRLRFAQPGIEPGLLWLGLEPPRPEERPADALVVLPPGALTWRQATAGEFRYALVLSSGKLEAVERWDTPGETPRPPWVEPAGAFGVYPPPRLPPLEVEIRRRLPRDLTLAPLP